MMVDGGNANGNKENGSMGCGNFSNSATASMIELCEEKQISVRNKVSGENVPITNGQQAFFALLSQDMNNLADRYEANYEDCLKIFYEVNCDRALLCQVLKNAKTKKTIRDKKMKFNQE